MRVPEPNNSQPFNNPGSSFRPAFEANPSSIPNASPTTPQATHENAPPVARKSVEQMVNQVDRLQEMINSRRDNKLNVSHHQASVGVDGYVQSKLQLGKLKKELQQYQGRQLTPQEQERVQQVRDRIAQYIKRFKNASYEQRVHSAPKELPTIKTLEEKIDQLNKRMEELQSQLHSQQSTNPDNANTQPTAKQDSQFSMRKSYTMDGYGGSLNEQTPQNVADLMLSGFGKPSSVSAESSQSSPKTPEPAANSEQQPENPEDNPEQAHNAVIEQMHLRSAQAVAKTKGLEFTNPDTLTQFAQDLKSMSKWKRALLYTVSATVLTAGVWTGAAALSALAAPWYGIFAAKIAGGALGGWLGEKLTRSKWMAKILKAKSTNPEFVQAAAAHDYVLKRMRKRERLYKQWQKLYPDIQERQLSDEALERFATTGAKRSRIAKLFTKIGVAGLGGLLAHYTDLFGINSPQPSKSTIGAQAPSQGPATASMTEPQHPATPPSAGTPASAPAPTAATTPTNAAPDTSSGATPDTLQAQLENARAEDLGGMPEPNEGSAEPSTEPTPEPQPQPKNPNLASPESAGAKKLPEKVFKFKATDWSERLPKGEVGKFGTELSVDNVGPRPDNLMLAPTSTEALQDTFLKAARVLDMHPNRADLNGLATKLAETLNKGLHGSKEILAKIGMPDPDSIQADKIYNLKPVFENRFFMNNFIKDVVNDPRFTNKEQVVRLLTSLVRGA